MTVKEKSRAIREWCDKRLAGGEECRSCVLHDRKSCYSYRQGCEQEEKIICENYEIVFDKGESEAVHHPSHYQGKNECIDVMVAMFGEEAVKHFCMCNAYKYRFRADKKNGEEDIKKAEWYESKLIELGGIDGSKAGTN